MKSFARTLLFSAIPLGLLSVTPAASSRDEPAYDSLKALGSICGQKSAQSAMRLSPAQYRMALDYARNAVPAAGAVPLIQGLDKVNIPIGTANEIARKYFNQGLALTYGFNHAGAIRSFRAAQSLDPNCAMCFWGEAYAYGPNINAPMDPVQNASTMAALDKAMALRTNAADWERALIETLAIRYSRDANADRAGLDMAYAQAMQQLAAKFPGNDDIAALAAESIMNTRPWDYWEADGRTAKGDIGRAVELIETVLARTPDHPQAIHLYIHLLEASGNPAKAEQAADRLAKPLMPGSGHLVHMPAHLYHVIGRYRDSIDVNLAAAQADEAWFARSPDAGIYRFGYYPHNVHFIVTSAQLGGEKRIALQQSERLKNILGVDVALALPWVQVVYAAPYFAHAQFSGPAEILAQPAPDARLPYATAMWHYSRAIAAALQSDFKASHSEIAEIKKLRETVDFASMVSAGVPAPDLLQLAEEVAQGRIAYAQKRFDDAVRHYTAAAEIESRIPYMEPSYWYYPVRQSLGAAQLAAGDALSARQSFMSALVKAPNNGWALYGLAETQRRLGDRKAMRGTLNALDKAWLGKDRRALKLSRL
ncbi:MAG: tetratricopeptide repeat protein [Sphingorhabdus sp.]